MDEIKNVEVEEALDLPETKEGEEDTTDWKAEAQKLREKAIRQRERTKELKAQLKSLTPEKKADASPETKESRESKSSDLDNGQKALLVAYGVKGADELALAKSWMQRTGDDIDVMISDDIFTAKLQALRVAKASQEALPSNTKRTGQSYAKDSVEYNLQKYESGEVQLADMPFAIRSKVLAAKMKKEKEDNEFSFTPSKK